MRQFYQFKVEDGKRFAQQLGIKTREHNGELQFLQCPYCHGGDDGHDLNTFSINTSTGQFKCLRSGCGAHGNMVTLARDFGFDLGSEAMAYYEPEQAGRFRKFKQKEIDSKQGAVEYLESRAIGEQVTRKYQITMRPDGVTMVFPFFDDTGTLQFIKYRNTKYVKGETAGSKEWCESNCKPILFGMHQCNLENKTLVLTEGQIDSLSCAEAGIENAVSVPTGALGFTWVPYCWDWLCKFQTLIVFGDYEHGHITLLDEMARRFSGTVKHIREQDYLDCKDANEILQKHGTLAIRNAIQNAVPVENPHIKALADVRRVNLGDEDKVSSGIKSLDNLIGGFYFGQLIILTGERGKGKSTLASQFVAYATEQHVNSLLYSGEMVDWQVQQWFERQIAGDWRINKIQRPRSGDRDPYTSYSVDGQFLRPLESFYRPYVYLYDNGILGGVDDTERLSDTILKAIQQYGVRFIVIDNLMTAMDDDLSSDIYREQTQFVKGLALMAKRYGVIIILVAHPKKRGDEEFTNDDVMGSSNITNLADVVLRYDSPKLRKGQQADPADAPRILQVWKNRLSGRTDFTGIPMFYQDSSKRMNDNAGEFRHDFIPQAQDQMEHSGPDPEVHDHDPKAVMAGFDTGPLINIDTEDLPF